MYGKDGDKYLGIDIKMPLTTLDELPNFPSNPYSAMKEMPAPEPENEGSSFFVT